MTPVTPWETLLFAIAFSLPTIVPAFGRLIDAVTERIRK